MSKQFKEWSDQKAKGHTTSNYQTWVEERARDKRLLAKSIGWSRGIGPKKVVMTKDAEDEVNLTAANGITPILIGATEAPEPRAAEDPGKEALPSTPEPAKEDTIMAGPAQSTPEAGNKEEPFPASTPDLNPDLMDKSADGDFDLDYNGTSSEDNMGGGVEESAAPQQDSVAGAGSNTSEGAMTPSSSADTTPQDNINTQQSGRCHYISTRQVKQKPPRQIKPKTRTHHNQKSHSTHQDYQPYNGQNKNKCMGALIAPPGGVVEDSPDLVVAYAEQETKLHSAITARRPVEGDLPRHQIGAWMIVEGAWG